MIEPRIIQLINKEIDGVNTPRASARLRTYLETHVEAREFFEEHVRLAEALQKIEPVPPPANLKKNILNAVRAQSKSPHTEARLLQWLASAIRAPRVPRYAFAFVAGLMVGILLYSVALDDLLQRVFVDTSELTGTVLPPQSGRTPQLAAKLDVAAEGVSGTIVVRASAAEVRVAVDLATDRRVTVALDYDEQKLVFAGFETQNVAGMAIMSNPGHVTFTQQARGNDELRFSRLSSEAAALRFTIRDERLLFEKGVEIAPVSR